MCTKICIFNKKIQNKTLQHAVMSIYKRPAECFSHADIFDILVCGEAFDKHCNHLDWDMLDQTGQGN